MEEAMHFLDGLKDKYLHQVEQAIEDWDFQDFSPDKRCALLDNEEEINERDDQNPEKSIKQTRKPRESWVGLSPDAKLQNYDCGHAADNASSYEAKLVAICTPLGGIQGIPDADSVQRLLTQIPHLDAVKLSAAFAERLQDDIAQQNWQVRARALLLMQMLVEIKPFAARYIPVFQANPALLQQVDTLRMGTHKQVIREGARKFLSLIQSNGMNPNLLAKGSPTAKPHVRHVQLRSTDKKKMNTKPAPTVQTQSRVFRPPAMSKATSLVIQYPRPSLVISPKVSQAARASWVRRNSIQKAEEDANLMPFQKIQPPTGSQDVNHAWMNTGMAPSAITVGGGSSYSSRFDSGSISAFSFVQ